MAMCIAGGAWTAVVCCVWRVLHYCPRPGVRTRGRARGIAPVRIGRRRSGNAHARGRTGTSDRNRWVRTVGLRLVVVRRRAQLVVAATARARGALAVAWIRRCGRLLWRVTLTRVVAVLRVHGRGLSVRRRWRCVCSLSISAACRARRGHMRS